MPDGGAVVVDKCYSTFRVSCPKRKVRSYVDALTTNRHRAFDFILICQQAKQQADGSVLNLIERHEHVRRKMVVKALIILCWEKLSENTGTSQIEKAWTCNSPR